MRHIALLRAINVGGHGTVAMADLRDAFAELGFDDVRTLLQTGNVVFTGKARSHASLASRLEAHIAERLGVRSDVMLRTPDELADVIARNPFPEHTAHDPARVVVMFLKDSLRPPAIEDLRAAIKGPELVHGEGKHAYLVYPNGMGRSRVTSTLIEAKLGTRGTARNWNTVLKLDATARQPGAGADGRRAAS